MVEFAKHYQCIEYDIDKKRVDNLNNGNDYTLEVKKESLLEAITKNKLVATSENNKLKECNVFIITVPTPTDKNNRPLLTPLISASELVGNYLKGIL